ncbi:restriction endonuclease subunit S [Curvibacter sp. HBC61]|uniref:Restriction endonuclease subunit S n=1 Tax=Curvibacter cyanobacteriorum TaxID=3026422 RepID=A0ABT5N2A6_9BURK|nr:restriction endonuclease subunit S [Curvibacter sp. HBC61]MDD0840439.1 restriction endonuclease subunit S [Curvibacter sp. HBC61]
MKSRFPIVELGKHVRQVSQRNRVEADVEVFSVTNSEGFTRSTDYFSKEVFSKDVSNYKIVSPGQFAYNPSRINVGSIDYLRHDSTVLVSPLYIVFEAGKDLHADYLLRYLKSGWGNAQIRANTEGAVRDSLKFKGLESINLPLPPLDDQIRIAHLLGKVEGLIAQRKQHLQQLDDLLKSVFLEMFGDPVRNQKGWEPTTIGQIIKVASGNGLVAKDMNTDGPYKVYGGNGVNGTHTEYMFDAPTLVIGRVGYYCGSVHLTEPKSWVTDNALYVKDLLKKTDLVFLKHLLAIHDLNKAAGRAAQPLVSGSRIYPIGTIDVPYENQTAFSAVVERVEALKFPYQQSLTDLEALYGALSQQAFKGELDLSRVPLLGIDPEKEKTVAAEPLQTPAEQSLAIHLPDTDNLLAALESAEARKNLLVQWLEAYLNQLGSTPFSVQNFMAAAQNRLAELHPDNDFELGANDYEHIKAWVFDALAAGTLTQAFDDAGNRIELKAAQA